MFVEIADRENVVRMEMPLANSKIMRALFSPAPPTTNPSRKKRIMPRMVRMLGVNTPEKVPNSPCFFAAPFFISLFWVIVPNHEAILVHDLLPIEPTVSQEIAVHARSD